MCRTHGFFSLILTRMLSMFEIHSTLNLYFCLTVTKTSVNSLSFASRVLLKFLLRRLQKHSDQCTISQVDKTY